MDEQKFEQTKELLENFSRVDDAVQDKLINGVKCLAFLYDLTDTDKTDKENLPLQAV